MVIIFIIFTDFCDLCLTIWMMSSLFKFNTKKAPSLIGRMQSVWLVTQLWTKWHDYRKFLKILEIQKSIFCRWFICSSLVSFVFCHPYVSLSTSWDILGDKYSLFEGKFPLHQYISRLGGREVSMNVLKMRKK